MPRTNQDGFAPRKVRSFQFLFLFSVCRDNTPVTYCRSNVSTESYFMCRPAFFCIICLLFFFFQSVCIFVRTHTGRLQTRAKIRTVRTSWIRQALLSLAKIQTARNKGNKKKGRRRRKTTNDQNGQPAKQSIMRKVCQFVTRELIINQFFST